MHLWILCVADQLASLANSASTPLDFYYMDPGMLNYLQESLEVFGWFPPNFLPQALPVLRQKFFFFTMRFGSKKFLNHEVRSKILNHEVRFGKKKNF
jgi:hypothetical protein